MSRLEGACRPQYILARRVAGYFPHMPALQRRKRHGVVCEILAKQAVSALRRGSALALLVGVQLDQPCGVGAALSTHSTECAVGQTAAT